ncbi:MAG: hypothetical protein ABIP35_14690 [Ginsengibacter sp.]
MAENKRYTFQKILVTSVWILLGAGLIVLLVAAITKKKAESVARIDISIVGVQNHYFINKSDVLMILEKVHGKKLQNATIGSLNLVAMEGSLQKEQWIKKAEIFFDNNNVLQIKIIEREPVARIFTVNGESYYMDSSLARLPLSDKFSARLPVFTNFPNDKKVWNKSDSSLGTEIKLLSEFIGSDPFWMAQIDQIDITPSRSFELIPKLGNQVIRFGNIENYKEKFNKLFAFYKEVQTRVGWNRYSIVDVQYKDQVVAVNRNKAEIKADSLAAVKIMKAIIEEAKTKINDTTQVQLPQKEEGNGNINESRVIDDAPDENVPERAPVIKNKTENTPGTATTASETPIIKSVIDKPTSIKKETIKKVVAPKPVEKNKEEKVKKEPKAVMPAKSDY